MKQPQRRMQRAAVAALVLLVSASLLAFGAVHEPARLAFGAAMALVGLGAVATRRQVSPRVAGWGAVVFGLLVLDALLHGFPVGSALRSLAQPALADLIERSLAVAGRSTHPLALDPRGHAVGQVASLGLLGVVLGTAAVVDRSSRAFRVALGLVLTGVGFAVLGLVQAVSGAESIYWGSGFGVDEAFFGTLVNANHGGALCAALIPWSLVLLRPAKRAAPIVAMSTVVLALGVWASGSRGALVVAVVATVLWLVLDRDRRVRMAGLVGVIAVVLALGVVGPRAMFEWLTAVVEPGRHASLTLTSGRAELYAEVGSLAPMSGAGLGLGGFEDAFHLVKQTPGFSTASQAHNDWLQTWLERGPLGLLLVGAVVASWLLGLRSLQGARPERHDMLAGALASTAALGVFALFDFPLRIGSLAAVLALGHGVILGLWAASDERQDGTRALWWVSGSVAVAAGFGVVWALASPSADRLLERGDRAASEGRLEEAAHAWRRALGARPLHQQAAVRLARLAIIEGDADRARPLLALSADLWPTHPITWLTRARMETAEGDLAAAAAAWRSTLALDLPEDDRNAWLDEAMGLHGDPVISALAVLPDRPDRWCQAAGVRAHAGDRAAADALYREAVALDDGCKLFYAHYLSRTGRAEEALPLVEDAADDCNANRVRGRVLLGVGRTAEAVDCFERSLAQCIEDDVWIRFVLARAKVDLGDERSLDTMIRIAEHHPDIGRTRVVYKYLRAAGRDGDAARWKLRLAEAEERQ